jgi:hypothetical protein
LQMQTGRAHVIEERILLDPFARPVVTAHHGRTIHLEARLAPALSRIANRRK